jgi:hypothetical protein
MSGVVFDPTFLKPQGELRAEVNQRRLWTVLDPLAFELSTPSGHTATDKLGRVSRSNLTAKVKIKLEKVQRRLEGWWQTLSELSRVEPAETFPATPERKVQSIVVRH